MARLVKAGWYAYQLLRSCGRRLRPPLAEVFIDVKNRSRRFLLLAHLLQWAGVSLEVHWTWRQFIPLNKKGYSAFQFPGVFLKATRRTSKISILTVTDEVAPLPARRPRKTLKVEYGATHCPDPLPPRTIFVPISFHPSLMSSLWFDRATDLAKMIDRTMGVFFAGNFDQRTYDKPHFRSEYGILNRFEILQIVRSEEFRGWVYEPESWDQLEADRKAGALRDRFVVVNSQVFAVPQSCWLETLAQARYFLAPPGYTQPFSHNFVEALSVGTVPFLNYAHLFRPKLVAEAQVFTFDTEASLRALLRRLRSNQVPSWEAMSHQAWTYQDQYLSPQSTATRIRDILDDPADDPWTIVFSGGK